MKKSRFIIIVAVLVLLVGQYTLSLAANPPEPTYGTAVVDGDISEWDLTDDYFTAMGEGFDPVTKYASDLYLRYDCSTQTLYELVTAVDGYIVDSDGDIWLALGDVSNKLFPTSTAFTSDFSGLEASYTLAPGVYTFLAHVNVNGGRTSGTPKDLFLDLVLTCPAGVDIEKHTNGLDADTPTGPEVPAGSLVTWTYTVTNTGPQELFGVSVVDDNGTPGDTADDFSPDCSWPGEAGYLAPYGSVDCTAQGIAVEGQYGNIAEVVGNTCQPNIVSVNVVECIEVMDDDPSHYIGTLDYGDLPDSFGMTTLAQNGARHSLLYDLNLTIGSTKDLEIDGNPNGSAVGDDIQNEADEEGVYRPTGFNWSDGYGELTVEVGVGGDTTPAEGTVGCLTGWLDFHDGAGGGPDSSFDDAGEYIIQNVAVMKGENQVTFPLPLGVADDATFFGRFRLVPAVNGVCEQQPLGYTGTAVGGEVEDQAFVFGPTAVSLAGFTAASSSQNSLILSWMVVLGAIGLAGAAITTLFIRKQTVKISVK
jgi:hypothetical protein